MHDARVFRNSSVVQKLHNLPSNYHVLANSAYPLETYMLTPFKDNSKLTEVQKRYNYIHSSSRCCVELDLKWIRLFLNTAKTTGFTKDIDIVVTDVMRMVHHLGSACICDCVGQRKKHSDGFSVEVTAHIHATDNAKNDAECVKAAIQQRAVNMVEWPRQIILQTTTGSSLEASQYLPAYSSLQRTINGKRKRENLTIQNPHSVHEIQIPDQLKVTTRGDSFLFWDSGEDDPQRLFVFCTDRNIDTLEQNAHWFMDGTFKVSPELFVQLFTIHALVDSRAMPTVYVLLQSKTQADYERVFRKLLERRNTLAPSSILLDFEKATL